MVDPEKPIDKVIPFKVDESSLAKLESRPPTDPDALKSLLEFPTMRDLGIDGVDLLLEDRNRR